jgi:putative ABC transport system permease protein
VVDRRTAEEQGWRIGEHIAIKGTQYPFDLDLTLCGIYEPHEWSISGVWVHWDYLEQGIMQADAGMSGRAGLVLMKAESAEVIPNVCSAIDDHFANSSDPTFTQAAHSFALNFSRVLGNVADYVRNLGIAVVFSLTMASVNTMAISVRERRTEIAVLKAIGYSPLLILALILCESLIVSVIGGLVGVSAGRGLFAVLHVRFPGMIPLSQMSWQLLLKGLAVAAGIGLISGFFPAFYAVRRSVIDGLRRVA